jgi:hypothetical protein
MLNTYIKNRGHTETLIHNNNQNKFNKIDWDADYDGNVANISLTSELNGNQQHYDVQLDNQDLANILNVPSVNMPIHKRLEMDFNRPLIKQEPIVYQIELPYEAPYELPIKHINKPQPNTLEELFQTARPTNYLSTPLPNEELIIPLTIDKKSADNLRLIPIRRPFHKTRKNARKTHKTYKVYKRRKHPSSRRKSHTSRRHIYL